MELSEEEKAKIQELEATIDQGIRDSYPDYSGRATVRLRGTPRERIRKEIERIYQEAGWNIKYHCCQRDGQWYELTPKDTQQLKGGKK